MSIFSFVKPGKKIFKTITSVPPTVNKTPIKKAVDEVKLTALKARSPVLGRTITFSQDITLDFYIRRRRKQIQQGDKVESDEE